MNVVGQIQAALQGARFLCANEDELQRAVAKLFDEKGIPYKREKRLGTRERLDFFAEGGIAIELKVKTDRKSLLRQVLRYADHGIVREIIVASTTHAALNLPSEALGKPVHTVHLMSW